MRAGGREKLFLENVVKYWITYESCASGTTTALMRHGVNTCLLNKDDQSKSISQLHWRWQCVGWITARTFAYVNNKNGNDFWKQEKEPTKESEWRYKFIEPANFLRSNAVSHLLIIWFIGLWETKKPYHTFKNSLKWYIDRVKMWKIFSGRIFLKWSKHSWHPNRKFVWKPFCKCKCASPAHWWYKHDLWTYGTKEKMTNTKTICNSRDAWNLYLFTV